MFEFCSVSKTFKPKKNVLCNITFKVTDGDIFAFLGKNGAGKTTAIKLLTGQSSPQKGRILIDSIDIEESPVEAKQCLSLVSEDLFLNERLTGLEHLRFFAQIYNIDKKDFDERVSRYANIFSMREMLTAIIKTYSSGMKQKLRIISSLVSDPHNWILDEPLNGLDPDSVFALKEIMRERAASGKVVFFSTHIVDVAEKLCTKIGILREGQLLFCGSLEQLRDEYMQKPNASADADLETIFFTF